jgi:hypothetical protein
MTRNPEPLCFSQRHLDIPDGCEPFPNGYHFPPKRTLGESLKINAIVFLRYASTPVGFAVVVYGLLIVAFGGMLFLLLCNAAPAMCIPTCDNIDSPRRLWIEIDSQILNALFCVTGFGFAPWRLRDLYRLLQFRLKGNLIALRRLAGIHRDWFRLADSHQLPSNLGPSNICAKLTDNNTVLPLDAMPDPVVMMPDPPLTGVRAPPTSGWKIDFVIWMYVANTVFQCFLAGFQWCMNRHTRPAWATGLFVGLGMLTGLLAGWTQFREKEAIKHIEGIQVTAEDILILSRDLELGIMHYNNLGDKQPAGVHIK